MVLARKIENNAVCLRLVHQEPDDLVEANLGLARAVASRFCRRGRIEDSEAYSIACLALVNAAETFDSSKAKFSTWATRIITQRIISELRRSRKRQVEVSFSSLDHKVADVVESESESKPPDFLVDVLTKPDPIDSVLESENKQILRLHFIERKSLSEIGKQFGMTKENVRLRTLKAISLIRLRNKEVLDQYSI